MKEDRGVVMNFILSFILVAVFLTSAHAAENHHLLTGVLQRHVKEGMVDYKNLCRDSQFGEYTKWLSSQDLSRMSSNESMAYWINAYNAFTLQLICENYPVKSINDIHAGGLVLGSVLRKTAWDKPFIVINDQVYTLNHIEHKILRPQYKDPRIHFAIVCAAKSCPPLRSEAYEASRLDQQLDDQAKTFLVRRTDLNFFEERKKAANLSAIFKWFRDDFGENNEKLLLYVSRYLAEPVADSIKKNPGAWRIKFNPYDWNLNER